MATESNFRDQYLGNWDATLEAVFTREEVATLYRQGLITREMVEPLLRLAWEGPERLYRSHRENLDFTLEDVRRLRTFL